MKKFFVVLCVIIVIALMIFLGYMGTASESSYQTCKQLLTSIGFLGEHNLLRLDEKLIWNSKGISGSFFLGCGSIDGGEISSVSALRFNWIQSESGIYNTTVPYEKIRVIPDDSKKIPTIEFVFTSDFLNRDYVVKKSKWASLSSFYTDDLPKYALNANLLLEEYEYKLIVVLVRMSWKDIEKEVFLPDFPVSKSE